MEAFPLSRLPIWRSGRICSLSLPNEQRRRLLGLGFTPGAQVCPLQRAPWGDPTAYWIQGAVIALRQCDASHIFVRLLTEEAQAVS